MKATHCIFGLLAPYRRQIFYSIAWTVLACGMSLAIPLTIRHLLDHVVAGVGFPFVPLLCLLALFTGQASSSWAGSLTMGRVGLNVVHDLRHRLYARLQRMRLSFYDKTPAGVILSHLMDDVAAVQGLITSQTLVILTDLGTAMAVSAWLLIVHPLLFLVVAAFAPVYLAIFRRFGRRMQTSSRAVRQQLDGIFGTLKEKLDGVIIVKTLACEEAEANQFRSLIHDAHDLRVQVGYLSAAFTHLNSALSSIGAALVFAVGAWQVQQGELTAGEVVAASVLAGLAFGPFARLSDLAAVLEQARVSLRRLDILLEHEPDGAATDTRLPIGRAFGRVEFDRVCFGYEVGQPVIRDIHLTVEPGTTVALVGPTACGKSTLLNLLLRFYDPCAGEIRIDGIPIQQFEEADLRRQIAVVPQDAVMFRASLADNIRYGTPNATMVEVEAAAGAALLHDLACRLPHGYDTIIGEGGYSLSQGERQRVAIARAFCKDAPIIVLDEATSSLDVASEAVVRVALINLLKDRAVLVIAHRLSTVMDADRIIVMQDGRIEQVGTPRALLADQKGLFRKLYLRQFKPVAKPKAIPASLVKDVTRRTEVVLHER